MADLDDVEFDYRGAADLAAELRSAARVVDHQVGERARVGGQAKKEWRGLYRERFNEWLTGHGHICWLTPARKRSEPRTSLRVAIEQWV